jgi:hypothetical protein
LTERDVGAVPITSLTLPNSDHGWIVTAKLTLREQADSSETTATSVHCELGSSQGFLYQETDPDISLTTLAPAARDTISLQLTYPANGDAEQDVALSCTTSRDSSTPSETPAAVAVVVSQARIQAVEATTTRPQPHPSFT